MNIGNSRPQINRENHALTLETFNKMNKSDFQKNYPVKKVFIVVKYPQHKIYHFNYL